MSTGESPILPPFNVAQQLQMRFWIKGNSDNPPELTVRRRTADGVYDDAPLIDLRQYGTVPDSGWVRVVANLAPTDVPYQVMKKTSLPKVSSLTQIYFYRLSWKDTYHPVRATRLASMTLF